MLQAFAEPPEEELLPEYTLVQYIGRNWGSTRFYGPVSGEIYITGLSIPFLPVRKEDLRTGNIKSPGILELRKGGVNVFQLHEAVEVDPVAESLQADNVGAGALSSQTSGQAVNVATTKEVTTSDASKGTPEATEATGGAEDVKHVSEYRVKDIRALEVGLDVWERLLEEELAMEED